MRPRRVFFSAILLVFSAAHAEEALRARLVDSVFGADKGHHFAACAMICATAHYAAMQEFGMSRPRSIGFSIGIALTAGAAKEIYDKRSGKGHASWLDLAADTAGIALAALLLNVPFH
ncbi:MAG: hypothetical protein ONA69_01850 [candidate division KSB1 bacterium]|nr:hypothetical protein [candidate division KSB1 bacterium]MDZ7345517.1 hypothetical protein [candidate division KSB1 bacterium]